MPTSPQAAASPEIVLAKCTMKIIGPHTRLSPSVSNPPPPRHMSYGAVGFIAELVAVAGSSEFLLPKVQYVRLSNRERAANQVPSPAMPEALYGVVPRTWSRTPKKSPPVLAPIRAAKTQGPAVLFRVEFPPRRGSSLSLRP